MDQMVLRDDPRDRIAPFFPAKSAIPARFSGKRSPFLEAVLWIVHVGAPWRDLPAAFGNWDSVFQRFRRWAKAGVFDEVFAALSGDADFEYAIIDDNCPAVSARHRCKGGLRLRPSVALAAG